MASIDVGDERFAGTDIGGRGYGVMLASIICPSIAMVFVGLRWYVRVGITKSLRFDDWIALITLLSNIAYSVVQGMATQRYVGIGLHQNQFDPNQVQSEYYKFVYIFDAFYILSLMGYKTAIVQLYIRVFGVRRYFKWTCFIMLFIIDGYLFASLISQLIGCIPPQKFWQKSLVGDCIDYLRFDISYGCLNIITDFMITVLPLYEIWRLFMPIKEKVWASFIFCSAFVAFGTAIVSQCFRLEDLFSDDRTYRAAVTFTWQTIEINTGLICSCTPALRPLWLKAVASLNGSNKSGNSSESSEAAIVRKNFEKEALGLPCDGNTSCDSEACPRHGPLSPGQDLEKGAPPNNIGMAVGGGRATAVDRSRTRLVHSDVYATPLPSDQERFVRHEVRPEGRSEVRPETANTDRLEALPEPAKDRGRAEKRTESKRLSQAELERMLLEANTARERLEQRAERSRQRHEGDGEGEAPRVSEFSVPLPMLDPMPAPVSPVTPSDPEIAPEPASPPAKKAKKKKSCDLEKGVGLRI